MTGPLSHIRVLDFGHSWAGPYTGMMLRDLGAEVIKVESAQKIEILRWSGSFADNLRDHERCGWFGATNRGKLSLTVNLKHPDAAETLLSLAEKCDIVIENFAPGILASANLPLERFRERNPRIITISMSGYGSGGPDSDFRSFGDHLLHASGFTALTGAPQDDHTRIGIFYGDPVGGMYAALALLAALRHRNRTGEGQSLELSQVEGLVSMLPGALARASAGLPVERSIDDSATAAPHGYFRCAGDDTWVSIAVTSDEQWARLRELLIHAGQDVAPYEELAERLAAVEVIESAVEAWTQTQSPWQVTDACQARGIAAFPVLSSQKLLFDDHLNARGFYPVVRRPITGSAPIPGVVFRVNGDGAKVRGYAPLLGEHNEYVVKNLLGRSDEEYKAMQESGLLH